MRNLALFVNCLFFLFFISCNTSVEGRIEDEFMKYAYENFDDPAEIEEITSISLSDSSNVKLVFETIEKLANDSTDFWGLLSPDEIYDKLNSLSTSQKLRIKSDVEKYVETSMKVLRFELEDYPKKKELADSIKSYISNIKSSDYDLLDTYEIKVRLNKKGTKKMELFYAIVNTKTGEIKIQDHELMVEEIPVLNNIHELVDEYIRLQSEYQDLYIEANRLENELLFKML